jgi:hypothetical protein
MKGRAAAPDNRTDARRHSAAHNAEVCHERSKRAGLVVVGVAGAGRAGGL